MSGHNKWKQIKDKKAKTDQSRGKLFSKLASVVSIAARENPDPKFNPNLRQAIDQAKKQNMPLANIERAINRAGEVKSLEELLIEAYGPEGVGLLIEAVTDNRNRTLAEVKRIFKDFDTKLAEPGALMWAFEKSDGGYAPKFPTATSAEVAKKVLSLEEALENHADVTAIYTSLRK
ncbi:MAG: YebC/PmpR family DNA-binding transcriptional regulator [Patescibacteria group bacterium]|nr:YebC/PmpR family DNA-binding transcriptional regulator [Patescibacteria group bacterium]